MTKDKYIKELKDFIDGLFDELLAYKTDCNHPDTDNYDYFIKEYEILEGKLKNE